jgi:hypothetical protein
MLEALVAGQRDPKVLAQMAKARMRVKIAELEEALRGFFTAITRRSSGPLCLPRPPGVVGQVLPQVHESAGKTKPKGHGRGNPWLAGTLGNIVATAARTDSFLGARYRRSAKRRGKQKAIVATGNSVLVIVYHLLGDPEARFGDLGAEHYDSRINKHRRARNLAAQLQAVTGQRIAIRDGKAVIVEPEAA